MKVLAAVAFVLFGITGCTDRPNEQQLFGRWRTGGNLNFVFTEQHTFTATGPDHRHGIAGKWTLHSDGELEMWVTNEVNPTTQQPPLSEQLLPRKKLEVSSRDIIQLTGPDGRTDTWTRINAP